MSLLRHGVTSFREWGEGLPGRWPMRIPRGWAGQPQAPNQPVAWQSGGLPCQPHVGQTWSVGLALGKEQVGMFTRCCLGQKKVPVPWKILEHCMVPIMGDSQGEPSQTVHVIECVPLCRMHKSGADFLSLSCESPRLSSVVGGKNMIEKRQVWQPALSKWRSAHCLREKWPLVSWNCSPRGHVGAVL